MKKDIYFDELSYTPEVVLNEQEADEYLNALEYFQKHRFLIGIFMQITPLNALFSKKIKKFHEKTKVLTEFNNKRKHYIFYQMADMLAKHNYDVTINGHYIFIISGERMVFSAREIPDSVFKTMRAIQHENKIKEESHNIVNFPHKLNLFNRGLNFHEGENEVNDNNVIYFKK